MNYALQVNNFYKRFISTFFILSLFTITFLAYQTNKARAATVTNVALNSNVTLNGSFFGSGWGSGWTVSKDTIVDGTFLPRSNQWDRGPVWWDSRDGQSRSIDINLNGVYKIESLIVQADDNDAYILKYYDLNSNTWQTAWNVPNYDGYGWGMQTRPIPSNDNERFILSSPITTNALKIEGNMGSGDRLFSVSEIQAFGSLDDSIEDSTSPNITNLKPSNGSTVNNTKPKISADYFDSLSGIDTTSVKLSIDGVDKTANSTITSNSVSYTPADTLSVGSHTAKVDVKDNRGNLSSQTWSFNVTNIPVGNVAFGKNVTLNGAPFFTSGWGGGWTVDKQTIVDNIFFPRQRQWDRGPLWWDSRDGQDRYLEIDLDGTFVIESFVAQVDDNDAYKLYYKDISTGNWLIAWDIPNYDVYPSSSNWGMQTRPNPANDSERYTLPSPIITSALMIRGNDASSDRYYSVSEIQAFGYQADNSPPAISNQSPANGETDVNIDNNITFNLTDADSGIDWSTLSIKLTGNKGYSKTYTDADTSTVSKTGASDNYSVTVDPDTDWSNNEIISIEVNVDDFTGNSLVPPAWSFTTSNRLAGAISHWKFNEGSGDLAADSAGNNDGSVFGANWSPGKFNGGLIFDGTDDYVDIPEISGNSSFTYELWALINPSTVGAKELFHTRNGGIRYDAAINKFYIYIFTDRNGGYSSDVSSQYMYAFTVNNIENKWTHIALAVSSDNTAKFYINGKAVYTGRRLFSSITGNYQSGIGAFQTESSWTRFFKGCLDDVIIYNRSVTAAEVLRRYQMADITKPVITNQTPAKMSIINNVMPTVSADYSDSGSGIDTSTAKILIDNIEKTSEATVTEGSISYKTSTALSAGFHSATVEITDNQGNTAISKWWFKVVKPNLYISYQKAYMSNLSAREMSVDYKLINWGTGDAFNAEVKDIEVGSGITVLTPQPLLIGTIAKAGNKTFTVKYTVPSGTKFSAKLHASWEDAGGNGFYR